MAIGLKMSQVKRFGQKVSKGAATFGRKLAKTAEAVGAVATPIATAINPALGAEVAAATQAVSKFGRGTQRLADKGVARAEDLFRKAQAPVLGVQEIARQARGAMKNPAGTQVQIGETIARRFGKGRPGIQRESTVQNDWAPDLPFAGGM